MKIKTHNLPFGWRWFFSKDYKQDPPGSVYKSFGVLSWKSERQSTIIFSWSTYGLVFRKGM